MTRLPFLLLFAVSFLIAITFPPLIHALGSGSTLAVAYGTATVCAIVASEPNQRIICYRPGNTNSSAGTIIPVLPNVSYSIVAGGETTICALRSGGLSLLCWETNNQTFPEKRLYSNNTVSLQSLTIGEERICATTNTSSAVTCWRPIGNTSEISPDGNYTMGKITSGSGFSCGIVLSDNNRVTCWGNSVATEIETQFGNMSMSNIEAGVSHVCGIDSKGDIICRGNNSTGQLNVPLDKDLNFASGLALGEGFSCAIRRSNGTVVCWGSMTETPVADVEFESIVSGLNFTCGLITSNFSVICWGPGWPETMGSTSNSSRQILPLGAQILPGPCVQSPCNECGIYPQSSSLCFGSGTICKPSPCSFTPSAPPLSPPSPVAPSPGNSTRSSPSKELTRGLLAFAIVGSVGGFMGICTVIYCLWTGVCFGKKKVHNSVQPTITRAGSNGGPGSNNSPPSRSLTIRRQSSRAMKRQRSGTSSKHADRAEEFSLAELAAATNDFSMENKIGAGSFGIVYRGKLMDGREVAIKRGETSQKTKKFQEKESAFDSELAFLSRLHHKHLVRLVGYCEERDERLLVYEYMKNGALYDHLHDKNNVEKSSSLLNSWKMRIKIALDAARGIEYLHNYAVPPIIHRDIKSSNILLDSNWTARVSDFGLSLLGPESDRDYRPMKAAGTVGYIDPEYYGLNVLTTKSDVYGLGVVMLELLTGKRAIFKSNENGGTPVSLVDYAVPAIMAGELVRVLDIRVGPPELNETEAVELVAYIAINCVNLEGKERPTIGDIVSNLERALTVCDGSHGSISSSAFSIVSE